MRFHLSTMSETEGNESSLDLGSVNGTVDEDDYDYYNINHRLQKMATKPHELIAIIFGTISIILNVIILLALYKVQNRITTHYRLIISLAVSDMLVGGSVLFYILNKVVNPSFHLGLGPYNARLVSNCTFLFIKALNTTGLNISLLNLATMAFDHYIAIMKPLQYPVIMTKKRVVICIVLLWVISAVLGFSDFLSAINQYQQWPPNINYCEKVLSTLYMDEFSVFAIAPICLGIMIFIYTRIYLKVLRRRRPGIEETNNSRSDLRRNSKALITTLLNIGTFVFAWLPLCLFEVTLLIVAKTNRSSSILSSTNQETLIVVNRYLYNLLIFNAIADPIIYTVRMREVRIGFARMCPCAPCADSLRARDASSVRSTLGSKTLNRTQSAALSTASDSLLVKMKMSDVKVMVNEYDTENQRISNNIEFQI